MSVFNSISSVIPATVQLHTPCYPFQHGIAHDRTYIRVIYIYYALCRRSPPLLPPHQPRLRVRPCSVFAPAPGSRPIVGLRPTSLASCNGDRRASLTDLTFPSRVVRGARFGTIAAATVERQKRKQARFISRLLRGFCQF